MRHRDDRSPADPGNGDAATLAENGVLHAILDAAPDGVALVNRGGRMLLATRRLEEMFGYASGALGGRPLEQLLPEWLRLQPSDLRLPFQRAPQASPMGSGRHLVGRRADGGELAVQISLNPLATEELGSCVIAVVRDETERRDPAAGTRSAAARPQMLIAHTMADTVIDGLFRTGLNLAGLAAMSEEYVQDRLQEAMNEIDDIIRALRSAVFELTSRQGSD